MLQSFKPLEFDSTTVIITTVTVNVWPVKLIHDAVLMIVNCGC